MWQSMKIHSILFFVAVLAKAHLESDGVLDIIVLLSVSSQQLHVRSHQDDNNKVHLPPWEELQPTVSTTMSNLPKLHHSFQHLKPASQSMAKPLLDDKQNNSNKQLAAPEHARDSNEMFAFGGKHFRAVADKTRLSIKTDSFDRNKIHVCPI
jgi:hypothetical protein